MVVTPSQAQDLGTAGELELNGILQEDLISETVSQSLLLDNTRSKVGRDFYEIFFRAYSQLQSSAIPSGGLSDTTATQNSQRVPELEMGMVLITIDELPANSGTGSIISLSVNDELLFQQFVQNRIDLIEELALLLAQSVREYVDTYDEVQRQLVNEDGRGTGIY